VLGEFDKNSGSYERRGREGVKEGEGRGKREMRPHVSRENIKCQRNALEGAHCPGEFSGRICAFPPRKDTRTILLLREEEDRARLVFADESVPSREFGKGGTAISARPRKAAGGRRGQSRGQSESINTVKGYQSRVIPSPNAAMLPLPRDAFPE
jgi:hypothetical protein